ncbi:hypothetical protein GCM10022197_40940 [Microlunatus spumicola]|uniref:Glycosyltransferase like family protein n=1 Tax=Microlunatus spumicola TaxID=81499 RepID=A0ABP6YA66_9ACTN
MTTSPDGRSAERRAPVTLVCVYNDERVLEDCLLRSVRENAHEAPDTEVIAVDNRRGAFASAGAALNHGARRARHPVVAFVHQDVYLHSLASLERVAGQVLDGQVDVAGAAGITSTGRLAGRVRDRVVMAGDTAIDPIDVDTLDEVLFLASRDLLIEEPLAEDPELAWHAYAVEYSLRLRLRGGRVAAVDVPLTHNSLSTNLAKLDLAHATVGARYPEQVPIRTTCGVVGGPPKRVLPGPLDARRWRYRWVKDSLTTASWHGLRGSREVVLSDIRESVDQLLAFTVDARPVVILNVVSEQDRLTPWPVGQHVPLLRRDRPITVGLVEPADVLRQVRSAPEKSFLVANVDLDTARQWCDDAPGSSFVGYSQGSGAWCVLGPLAEAGSRAYGEARDRPLDLRLRLPTGARAASGAPA